MKLAMLGQICEGLLKLKTTLANLKFVVMMNFVATGPRCLEVNDYPYNNDEVVKQRY